MIGRGRKGLSTKLHLALSFSGIQSACLSEGQRVDMKVFPQLWQNGEWENTQYIIADKGYDYFDVRHPIRKAGKIAVIPRRANATVPGLSDNYKSYYRSRSTIE
ncbi:MAG TPA: transposase [Candidatus Rhabdochlamydia sp.]|nr:transposase [Candidatus Rhabdochlamydia sp.]